MTEPAAISRGWLEAWIVRCGERPWRSFCWLWLFLFALSLVQAMIGFNRQVFPARWPDPAGIDYQKYLVGGDEAIERGGALATPRVIPAYDASKRIGVFLTRLPESGKETLFAYTPEELGSSGWRTSTVLWGVQRYWDVSDPERIVDAKGFNRWSFQWHYQSLGVGMPLDEGSRGFFVSLRLPESLVQLALPQTIAAALVGIGCLVHRVRQWRRRKSGRCFHCGHQFDPQRPAIICVECGCEPCSPSDRHRERVKSWVVRDPEMLAVMLFAVMVAILSIVQWQSSHDHIERTIPEVIAARLASGNVHRGRAGEVVRSFGWPTTIVHLQIDQWYDFGPGDRVAPSPPVFPVGWDVQRDEVRWTRLRGGPNRTVMISLFWSLAVAELAVLQVASTWLTLVIVAVMRRRNRTRIIAPDS